MCGTPIRFEVVRFELEQIPHVRCEFLDTSDPFDRTLFEAHVEAVLDLHHEFDGIEPHPRYASAAAIVLTIASSTVMTSPLPLSVRSLNSTPPASMDFSLSV